MILHKNSQNTSIFCQNIGQNSKNSFAPVNNMGVTENTNLNQTDEIEINTNVRGGYVQKIKIPRKNTGTDSRSAFVDQISFSLRVHSVTKREIARPWKLAEHCWPDCDVVPRLSSILIYIFGFGTTTKRDRGLNFYQNTWNLGDSNGTLSWGGQNGTVNVQITGQGAAKAKKGWEKRLFAYLKETKGWITRVDCAADYFNGQYTPLQAEQDFLNGKMSLTNNRPHGERVGDWYGDKGKTFYIGTRESGKLSRVYEKGLQLLSVIAAKTLTPDHPLHDLKKWVRIETEWHNKARLIPLDILLYPGQYLAGSYPAYSWISELQDRIKTIKKQAQATVERAKKVISHQFGASIYALIQVCGVEVIREITRGKWQKLPAWTTPFNSLPEPDDDIWHTWESEMARIPF